MKVLKTTLALCLALLLCALAGACTNNKSASIDDVFDFASDNYSIVRSASDKGGVGLSAAVLSAVKKDLGVSPKCVDDTADNGAEIIIGLANRESTAKALEFLCENGGTTDNDYIICKSGDDVVIVGVTDEATQNAVEYFVETKMYAEPMTEESGYVHLENASYNTVKINGQNIGYLLNPFRIVTPLYNHSYVVEIQVANLIAAVKNNTSRTLKEYKDSSVAALPSSLESYSKAANFPSKESYDAYCATFDALDKSITVSSYAREIIIGNCNRSGCRTITNPNEYEIRIEGYKVYLNGGSPYATAMAVSEFAKMVSSGNVELTNESSVTGDYYDVLPSYDKSNYYTLTWGDDFEGKEINEGLWHISYDSENAYAVGLNGRNNYRASKDLKNNYVKNGKLYIDAVYTDDAYYGGMLITNNTMRYKYGYVEVSSMLPHGQGMWTALWASSDAGEKGLAYTEIDISECYGPSHYVLGNTFAWLTAFGKQHYLDSGYGTTERTHYHKRNEHFSDARGFSLDMHTFGYEWDEEKVQFICDGEVYKTMYYASTNYVVSSSAADAAYEIECCVDAFSTPIYLRLSMALGFDSRGYIVPDGAVEWTQSNSFVSDYVHVYQYEDNDMFIYATNTRVGDISGDGVVDMLDSAAMARYLASWNRYDFSNLNIGAGDLDGDGLVTSADLIKLNHALAGNGEMWGESNTEPDIGNGDEDDEWMDWVG